MSPLARTRQALSPSLVAIQFDQLKGWNDDDHLAAFHCFAKSAERMSHKAYSTKSLGISATRLAEIANGLSMRNIENSAQAQEFFERNFTPHRFRQPPFSGLLTGYYEPVLPASRHATPRFRYPLYRRPDDLIDLDATNRPLEMDDYFAFGRQTKTGIVEYYDRTQIEQGALNNRGLELYWLENPIDVFFIHIQGSAQLQLENGSTASVSYAAKSGHPYTAIGKILVEQGEMKLQDVTMQTIRKWLENNSRCRDQLLAGNRSFIFFQNSIKPHPDSGPIAAAGVALTQGRSLAIDHTLHTFGTPVWVKTKTAINNSNSPLAKLFIAQDTGSAIVGPQRADLFTGSGITAGNLAGNIKHTASLTVMVPNSNARC